MLERKIRILLADDHVLFAEGLRRLLELDYDVIDVVTDGHTLIERAAKERPDLVITDISMPGIDGIDAAREVRAALPGAYIVMLSMHEEAAYVRGAFEAGANAYLLKSSAASEINLALVQVLAGHQYVTPSLTLALMNAPAPPAAAPVATGAPIRVLLADDQEIVRISIGAFLESFEGIEIVGLAENGREAVEQAASLSPDVILLDLSMPEMNGIEATEAILASDPEAHILMLTVADHAEVLAAVQAGALGYVAKNCKPDQLRAAIRRVARGEPSLPLEITRRLLDSETGGSTNEETPDLTEREHEIVVLVARGMANKEIAQELFVAEVTVRTHVRNMTEKLGVKSRVELVLYALRRGWAELTAES